MKDAQLQEYLRHAAKEDYIRIPDLVPRRLYRIWSRNLGFGVWDHGVKGFLGIREKLGRRFIFTEYHWDQPYYPTVKPLEDLGVDLPPEIPLVSYLPGTLDVTGTRHVTFDKPVDQGGKGWTYTDTGEPAPGGGYYQHNDALLAWLEAQEKTYAG